MLRSWLSALSFWFSLRLPPRKIARQAIHLQPPNEELWLTGGKAVWLNNESSPPQLNSGALGGPTFVSCR